MYFILICYLQCIVIRKTNVIIIYEINYIAFILAHHGNTYSSYHETISLEVNTNIEISICPLCFEVVISDSRTDMLHGVECCLQPETRKTENRKNTSCIRGQDHIACYQFSQYMYSVALYVYFSYKVHFIYACMLHNDTKSTSLLFPYSDTIVYMSTTR